MTRAVIAKIFGLLGLLCFGGFCAASENANLFRNGDFEQRDGNGRPVAYQLASGVEYRYLGDPRRDSSSWGVALEAARNSGLVTQTVKSIDATSGRSFRFSFRGLPQDNFTVSDDDLFVKFEFFGGEKSFDSITKKIYPEVLQARRDISVNGVHRVGGAAVWRSYQVEFRLPFPQIDQVRVSVGFGHGTGSGEFFVDDFSLVRIVELPVAGPVESAATTRPAGELVPLGGRWFYQAAEVGATEPPSVFDYTNADRLLYHDGAWSAPFSGNMTAWLRAGDKDINGIVVAVDRFVADNVTVSFDASSLIMHTHGLPNHPTGKFPEAGFGNPNYIQEHNYTYYLPLNPQVNPNHAAMTDRDANRALPMGPTGVAVNGVVFFNPFDAGMMDATDLMDRCCGHPNPDGQYHYHKYPVCVNSPWDDDGEQHSPVIGWAFDGFPIYGPYESKGVMAKDVVGKGALNDFNAVWDEDRGWHYHVTPGKFPYIIGGYWGVMDRRDVAGRRGPPPGVFRPGPGGGPSGGFGPPPP
jgi:YHYH protein